MSMDNAEKTVSSVLKKVKLIVGNPVLEKKLNSDDGYAEVLNQFELPESALRALRDLLNRINLLKESEKDSEPREDTEDIAADKNAQKVVWESFSQMRLAFWISMGMSIVLFLIGLTLLTIAVVKAIPTRGVSASALTIGGLSLGDFLILFLRRPWQDISENLSNSQQVRMIVTSYLSSLSFLSRGKPEDIEPLEDITRTSVLLLQGSAKNDELDHNSGMAEEHGRHKV